jgi:iron complex outermembrane receptor protein
MNVAISRKRPRLLYALVVALPLTAQAEETVVVTASPPASASAPTEGYSASTSLGATKTDQPLITTAQSVSVVTRQQMADQGRIPSARRWNIPRGLLQLRRRRDPVRRHLPARLPRRRRR